MKAIVTNKIKTEHRRCNISLCILTILSIASISSIVFDSILYSNNALALTYSEDISVNFTFSPSLTVSLSSPDIVINDLTPGSSSDSNVIDINVLSNNLSGYNLISTVGNSTTYNNRNLNHTNDSATFNSLDYGSSETSLTTDNTWGYSYSDQTVTTPTWSNYSGLPLYSDTTNIATLRTSTGPSSSTGDDTYFKIAAKASTSQPAGTYSNVINFAVIAEHNPVSFYDAFTEAASLPGSTITTLNGYYKMQDMTADICNSVELYDDDSHIQLIDTRDHEVYYIGKLKDNRCWLLDNLRLGSNDHEIPLTPEDTNIAEDWVLPKGVTRWEHTYTTGRINAASKTSMMVNYGTASGMAGVYYNYCAASAGTYCYDSSNGGDTEYDICATNWQMPKSANYRALFTDYYTSQNAEDSDSVQHNLAITLSGRTTEYQNTEVFLWPSTYGSVGSMYRLGAGLSHVGMDINTRGAGNSVRCIASNS